MQEAVIVIAQYFVAIPVLVFIYVLWRSKSYERKQLLITLVLGTLVTVLLAKLGSAVYNDPRPFVRDGVTPLFSHAPDNGFPSDHTTYSTLIAWAVFTRSKVFGGILLVVALLVGGSRVMAGVHHGWDIAGGFAIATLGFCLSGVLIHFVRKVRNRRELNEE